MARTRFVGVVDQDLVEEGIDRCAQGGERLHGAFEVLGIDRIVGGLRGRLDGGGEGPSPRLP